MSVVTTTKSLCPRCLRVLDAAIVQRDADFFLEKTCAEHGAFSTIVWRGVRPSYGQWDYGEQGLQPHHYETEAASGCPFDCGLCNNHLSATCTVLMEVTERCNMACPICFASSQPSEQGDISLATIERMFETILEAGGPFPLQLSGGEPTVRDDLPEILALAKEFGFAHIQVNTNGLRIAQESGYAQRLKEAGADLVYLQLDGVSDATYQKIRGRRLHDVKRRALEQCAAAKIGVELVPVLIRGINDHEVGGIVRLAKEFMPVVKGIHFQPASFFGRYLIAPSNDMRITTPDVLHALEEQTQGEVRVEHFLPRGKIDSHCGFSAFYVLNRQGELRATTHYEPGQRDFPENQKRDPYERTRDFITTHSRFVEPYAEGGRVGEAGAVGAGAGSAGGAGGASAGNVGGIGGAGAESARGIDDAKGAGNAKGAGGTENANGTHDRNPYERALTHGLSISGMPFMDVWNVDLHRLQNCCVHVVRQDGRLVPFCAQYITDAQGNNLPGIDFTERAIGPHARKGRYAR